MENELTNSAHVLNEQSHFPDKSKLSHIPSPIYLDVREAALILKNVHFASVATALANIVLPLPGGPNKSNPRAGALSPLNRSGRNVGNITEIRSIIS